MIAEMFRNKAKLVEDRKKREAYNQKMKKLNDIRDARRKQWGSIDTFIDMPCEEGEQMN